MEQETQYCMLSPGAIAVKGQKRVIDLSMMVIDSAKREDQLQNHPQQAETFENIRALIKEVRQCQYDYAQARGDYPGSAGHPLLHQAANHGHVPQHDLLREPGLWGRDCRVRLLW